MTGAAVPLELVIFDCDGVLVDSEPIAVRIDKLVLEQLGMPLTEQEIIERFVGRSASVMRSASSDPDRLRHKLGLVGLYERFAGRIFSAAQVANGKPAPDLFLFAAERMGAAPEACVVVEDSRHGVMAARAAGMDVFAYTGSVTPAHALAGERTTVFDDMRRLPALLAGR